jgi:hypothetical protein
MPSLADDTVGRTIADQLSRTDVTTTTLDPAAVWRDGRRRQRRIRLVLAGTGTGVCAIAVGAVAGVLALSGPTGATRPASTPASAPVAPSPSGGTGLPCPAPTRIGFYGCTSDPVPTMPPPGSSPWFASLPPTVAPGYTGARYCYYRPPAPGHTPAMSDDLCFPTQADVYQYASAQPSQ